MSSRRFPAKMLAYLAGMPLIEYVYRRCKLSSIKNIWVATSKDSSDDALYRYCKENNINVLRGDLENVLERYILAAESLNAGYIIRVCADTLFVDIPLMQLLLHELISGKFEYVSFNRANCASCFISEAVTLQALKKVRSFTKSSEDLEHVTKFIIDNREIFLTKLLDVNLNPPHLRNIRLTIDLPEDLELAGEIVNELPDKLNFSSQDILNTVCKKRRLGCR